MSFSPARYRSALSGLLIAASVSFPALSATSFPQTAQYPLPPTDPQCGALSPRLLAMGDNYYRLDTPSQQNPDSRVSEAISHEALQAALLSREYTSGMGQRTDCFGSGDSLQPRSRPVILQDISRETENGSHSERGQPQAEAIVLKAWEYDERQRRVKAETMVLPLTAIAVETFSGLLINSHQRHRQKTPTGSYLRETELTALQTDDELILQQAVYINGSLAQWSSWQMRP
ncbi:hypothetical protein ACUNV4_07055 [Granulosicoccus sp. 3-233]|uniref:hypothetical protein n=1 Tax=Granulosicoccus sp. 3-233 TaxID=3417969 RepID=UPI003D32AF5C